MSSKFLCLVVGAAMGLVAQAASAQTFGTPFQGAYTLLDLGSAVNVPGNYGGLTFKAGDPNTLLLGGAANGFAGAVYEVPLVRGTDGHITGYAGPGVLYSSASQIDGGLDYAPNGVLVFVTYSNNMIGQILPAGGSPSRMTDLGQYGIYASTGSLVFVPQGQPGAGRLKVLSYSGGRWYDMPYEVDGLGLLTFSNATETAVGLSGPEGAVYVPRCSPGFGRPSTLVAEYGSGRISAFEIDSNGDPLVATRRDFLTGLGGAEGAALDPLTSDFVFCTFGGGNRVLVVRGFPVPCPADFDKDCFLTGVDFDLFVTAFENGDESADFDHDGFITGVDFDAYVQSFESGC